MVTKLSSVKGYTILIKNTLVKHGLTRISGFGKRGLSLYDLEGNHRLCQNAKIQDCRILTRLNFNYRSGFSSVE